MTDQIGVHNEWDPLQEVIVGTAKRARFPISDIGFSGNVQHDKKSLDVQCISPIIPQWMIDETEEDLSILVDALEKLGIVVYRPEEVDTTRQIKTPYWDAESYFNYCPRDIFLAINNFMIETSNVVRSRYFESFSYREILLKLMAEGRRWISAPKPRLRDQDYNVSDFDVSFLENKEPIFDAANVIKVGRDIFYLLSNSGNQLGAYWLQSILGDQYKLHLCEHLYSGVHIDSTLAFLRPGLVLANPARVNENNLPELLKKWEVIYAPPMVEYRYSDLPLLSSPWLGMNLLMINPNLAVVDAHQVDLICLLAKYSIEVIPLKLRHGRVLGGGFHCVTLDVKRKGRLENYF